MTVYMLSFCVESALSMSIITGKIVFIITWFSKIKKTLGHYLEYINWLIEDKILFGLD